MKINPNLKKMNCIFYNRIFLIMLVFALLSFLSSYIYASKTKPIISAYNIVQGELIGPIKVYRNPVIYEFSVYFNGSNSAHSFSCDVLDEKKDVLYEIEKDFWHESGYDSEGYWSESDSYFVAHLNFDKKGTYYIRLNNADSRKRVLYKIKKATGSYVPHYMLGSLLFMIAFIGFLYNRKEA